MNSHEEPCTLFNTAIYFKIAALHADLFLAKIIETEFVFYQLNDLTVLSILNLKDSSIAQLQKNYFLLVVCTLLF